MRLSRWFLGPALLLGLMSAPGEVQAFQGRGSVPGAPGFVDNSPGGSAFRSNVQRAGGLRQNLGMINSPNGNKHALSTHDTSRFAGIITVPDQLRSLLPGRTRPSRFDFATLPTSRAKLGVDGRNLTSARSPLARKAISASRNDFAKDDQGQMAADYSRIEKESGDATSKVDPLKPDDGAYQRAILQRLQEKSDEFFDRGAAAFKNGQLINARNYFDLVREVEPDKTRPYLANVFVAVQKGDYLTAHGNLIRAMDIMHDIEELRMEPTKFYKAAEDLKRRTETINLIAQRNPSSPIPSLVLAYYSWLNGDVGTAISAAASAEKNSPAPADVPVKKFREQLIRQRSTANPAN